MTEHLSPALRGLGWSDFFASQLSDAEPHLLPARVSAQHRGGFELIGSDGPLRIPNPRRVEPPCVGDWVLLEPQTHEPVRVLERACVLSRKVAGRRTAGQVVAANVDRVFVVTSVNADFSPRRLERYVTSVVGGGASPVLVLSKIDLEPSSWPRFLREAEAVAAGFPVVVSSAVLEEGIAELAAHLGPGLTGGFVGSSGVGKSSLVNALLGEQAMDVNHVRHKDETGQHTTTRRQLLRLPEGRGLVVDTPGMRELQPDVGAGLDGAFPEISGLAEACRWPDCKHLTEPDCAVLEALERGELDEVRLQSWRKLVRDADRLEASRAWMDRAVHRRRTRQVREAQKERARKRR